MIGGIDRLECVHFWALLIGEYSQICSFHDWSYAYAIWLPRVVLHLII